MNKAALGTIVVAVFLGLSKSGSKNNYTLKESDILPFLKKARLYLDFNDFINNLDNEYFMGNIRKRKDFTYKALRDENTGCLYAGEPLIYKVPKADYAEEFTLPENMNMNKDLDQVYEKGRDKFFEQTGIGKQLKELYSEWKDYTPNKNFAKKITAYHFSPYLFDTFKNREERTMGQDSAGGFHFFYHAEDNYHKKVVKDLKDNVIPDGWYVYTVELNAESIGGARGEDVAWGSSRDEEANESLVYGEDTIFWITMNDTGLAFTDEILVSTDDNIKIVKTEKILGNGQTETIHQLSF